MASNEESASEVLRCSNCDDEIDGQPLYPSSDIKPTDDGLKYVEDPDGPFCDAGCRREYDGE
jgi:hypothetical protein